MDPLFEIDLRPVAKGSRDAAKSIYRQLKEAILDGRLTPGAKLPPTRKSAAFFGTSRTTAVEVYGRLLHEGDVMSRRGSGTDVADNAPVSRSPSGKAASLPAHRLNPFWLRPDVT